MPLHIYPLTIRSVSPAIHCLLSRPATEFRSAPTVIYFHGLNGSRNQVFQDRYVGLAEAVQKLGCNLVSFDLRGHGERREDKSKTAVENLLPVMAHPERNPFDGALQDIRKVTEFLVEKSIAPSREMAVMGLAWGGMHALYALKQEPMIRCGVALLPVCRITDLVEFRKLEGNSLLESFEPVRFMKSFNLRPLLIVSGEKDTRVDPAGAAEFYEALLPKYEEANRTGELAYTMLLGAGHAFHPRMIDLSINWFKRYLLTEEQAPKFI